MAQYTPHPCVRLLVAGAFAASVAGCGLLEPDEAPEPIKDTSQALSKEGTAPTQLIPQSGTDSLSGSGTTAAEPSVNGRSKPTSATAEDPSGSVARADAEQLAEDAQALVQDAAVTIGSLAPADAGSTAEQPTPEPAADVTAAAPTSTGASAATEAPSAETAATAAPEPAPAPAARRRPNLLRRGSIFGDTGSGNSRGNRDTNAPTRPGAE